MPKYSIKDLLIATTEVAFGLGLLVIATKIASPPASHWTMVKGGLVGGGSMTIGGGIARLITNKWRLGYFIGAAIMIPAAILVF